MGNEFSANILLCKEITDDKKFEGVFNNLAIEDNEEVTFDIAIFLTKNIVEIKEEIFLLNVAFDQEDGTYYHPIGTSRKNLKKVGKSVEVSAFKGIKMAFEWEGLYKLEYRKCKEDVDINSLDDDALIEFIKSSDLIQNFTFSVEKMV